MPLSNQPKGFHLKLNKIQYVQKIKISQNTTQNVKIWFRNPKHAYTNNSLQ